MTPDPATRAREIDRTVSELYVLVRNFAHGAIFCDRCGRTYYPPTAGHLLHAAGQCYHDATPGSEAPATPAPDGPDGEPQ